MKRTCLILLLLITWGVVGATNSQEPAGMTAEQYLAEKQDEGDLKEVRLSFGTTTDFQPGEFYQVAEGIWVAMNNRLDQPEFYYKSMWEDNPSLQRGQDWIKWYEQGYMQMRRLIGSCSGDYLSFWLIMDPDKLLVLDRETKIALFYEDRVIVSERILVPDGPEEKVVYQNVDDTIVFSEKQDKYFRFGPFFLFAARFPDNTIGAETPSSDRDYNHPIAFGIEKGGTTLLIPGDWSQVVEEGVTLSFLATDDSPKEGDSSE